MLGRLFDVIEKPFESVGLKYKWVVKRDAWYFKFHIWLWQYPEERVTFCRMFWGYATVWLVLPPRLVWEFMKLIGRGLAFVGGFLRDCGLVVARGARFLGKTFSWVVKREQETYVAPEPVDHVALQRAAALELRLWREEEAARQRELDAKAEKLLRKAQKGPGFMERRLENIANGAARAGMRAREGVGAAASGAAIAANLAKEAASVTVVPASRTLRSYVLSPLAIAGIWALDRAGELVFFLGGHLFASTFFVTRLLAKAGRWALIPFLLVWILGQAAAVTVFHASAGPAKVVGKGLGYVSLAFVVTAAVFALGYALFLVGNKAAGVDWGSGMATGISAVAGAIAVSALAAFYFMPTIGLYLAGILAVIAVGLLAGLLMTKVIVRYVAPAFLDHVFMPVGSGVKKGSVATGRVAKKGTLSFFQIMWIGLKAVKSNTCPKIEVED